MFKTTFWVNKNTLMKVLSLGEKLHLKWEIYLYKTVNSFCCILLDFTINFDFPTGSSALLSSFPLSLRANAHDKTQTDINSINVISLILSISWSTNVRKKHY